MGKGADPKPTSLDAGFAAAAGGNEGSLLRPLRAPTRCQAAAAPPAARVAPRPRIRKGS